VLLSGPFTGQIHDAQAWRSWVARLGGEPVTLVWVRSNAETLRHRLITRQSGRDANKLAAFEEFLERMRPETPPVVPHLTIDNRLGAPALEGQVARALAVRRPD
jgi:hypothetical protein